MDVLSDGSAADVELADQVVLRLTRDGTYTPIIVMLLGAKPLDRDRLARVHRALGKLIYANNLHQSEPQVLEALRKAPAAAVSLLVQADLAGSAPDCLRMLTWGGLIPELAPFHDVAIIGLRADEQRVREAEQFGPQAASLLKRLEERWSRPGGSSPPATGALGAPVAAPAGALDAAAGGVAGEGDKDVTP
jgi:hypothetical protein